MRRTMFLLGLVLLTASCAHATRLTDAELASIRSVDAQYVAAISSANWEALANLLSENGTILPPNEPAVVGRVANLARLRTFPGAPSEYVHNITEVGGDRDWGYLQGTYVIRMTVPGAASEFRDRGKYLWVLHRGSDRWLIHKITWNSDGPSSPR